jgi:chromate transporter
VDPEETEDLVMPVILQLFFSFLQVGLLSIGGGYATIPLIQQQVVQLHQWLTFQEFTDIITISQMTPGPLAVNTSTFVGLRIGGIGGALVATLGCVVSGFCISLLLYWFFHRHQENQGIQQMLKGLRAASIGLIASSAGTILLIALCGTSELTAVAAFSVPAAVLVVLSILALRKLKLPPVLVMVLCGGVGLLLHYLPADFLRL